MRERWLDRLTFFVLFSLSMYSFYFRYCGCFICLDTGVPPTMGPSGLECSKHFHPSRAGKCQDAWEKLSHCFLAHESPSPFPFPTGAWPHPRLILQVGTLRTKLYVLTHLALQVQRLPMVEEKVPPDPPSSKRHWPRCRRENDRIRNGKFSCIPWKPYIYIYKNTSILTHI